MMPKLDASASLLGDTAATGVDNPYEIDNREARTWMRQRYRVDVLLCGTHGETAGGGEGSRSVDD